MSALAEAPLAPSYANVCMFTSHSRKQLDSAAIRCVQGSTWKATVVTDQCGHAFTVKKEELRCAGFDLGVHPSHAVTGHRAR